MIIIYLILILALIILNFFKSKKTLHMLQQNLYNENIITNSSFYMATYYFK